MNRFDRSADRTPAPAPSDAKLSAAELRFKMIRRIKARVRAERALGFSDAQILGTTQAIHEREIAKRVEALKAMGQALGELALHATREALAEPRSQSAPVPFDRWLAETINKNRSFVPMTVVPGQAAKKD
jgi:hypothetical protein